MGNKPRTKRPKQVSIFISYAREDADLAATVHAELLQLFAFTQVEIYRDVGTTPGSNYQTTIDVQLDRADILLVLVTDRMKPSFSYTGYEVGFFRHSILKRPKIYGDVDRVIIPVCIGINNPDALHYVESIQIDSSKIFRIEDTATRATDKPAATLLGSISEIVMDILGAGISSSNRIAAQERLSTSASRLDRLFSEYLQGRVTYSNYPERKIIIRNDTLPKLLSDGADLSTARIELVGNSFQVFGFPDNDNREFLWSDFAAKMPDDFRGSWVEGIRVLVAGMLQGNHENYHVVTTPKGDNAFRLFVSQIVTFFSQKTEIHIYIVQMIVRHYGDAVTSRLLSAISVGLQFRFLFLEKDSKFRPGRFLYPMSIDAEREPEVWKSTVTELIAQMDLVLREAKNQHLMDADLLDKIWSPGNGSRVQEMMGIWEGARAKLYAAAQQILTSSASEFAGRQAAFREALKELCDKTEIMNREYTLRALRAITKEIGGALGDIIDPPAVTDARPQPATASTLAAS